ncbi:MAG: DNA repair protein RecN [Anaerolineales bacterium]|nr:DNA repair protein RecN [Anaerolineales bacterium]
MLIELRIQDYAIIDDLRLELAPGFIVFTGETGAGKSIIVDAVEMLLGGRADSSVVRTEAERALLEGTFRIEDRVRADVHKILDREGMLDDPEFVVLGREIRLQGRNVCRVNGRTVTLGMLRELGEWLVDVHGQSEHLSLLRIREHLHLLDRYAQVESLRETFTDAYHAHERVRRELRELRQHEQDAARKADLLAFQINEIESASLKLGEDQSLLEERTRLANAEQLIALAEKAIVSLDESPPGMEAVTDLLGRTAHALGGLSKVDGSVKELQTEAQALVEQASDLARRLRVYLEGIEFNPKRLDEVEERLGLVRALQRKYGETIEEILSHGEQAREELEAITHAEERIHALEVEEKERLAYLGDVGAELSQARRQAAEELSLAIDGELGDLHMEGAHFGVEMAWVDDPQGASVGERRVAFSATGLDQVEFLVAPNPGEGLKPLAKIASGGETSRMMLGLKSVLAQADRTPTLIFDEIDQGIGGRVGAVVGQKLWALSRNHQVLCVTHLPQLAAFGDQHYRVEKQVQGGRTVTVARPLEGSASVPELALMLGGQTEPNLESATELLRTAAKIKAEAAIHEAG